MSAMDLHLLLVTSILVSSYVPVYCDLVNDVLQVNPGDMCFVDVSPGVVCENSVRERRFFHKVPVEGDENVRVGCLPFLFEGCEANINNFIAPTDCLRFCQTFKNMPLRTDITFTASHNAGTDFDHLLSQDFIRDLEPIIASLCGDIEVEKITNTWVAAGVEGEINMGFRIEGGARLQPEEAAQAFTVNLDNGDAIWTFSSAGRETILVAVPGIRTVDHYSERTTIRDSMMLLIACVLGFAFGLIAICCVGCLVQVLRKLKNRIANLHKHAKPTPLKQMIGKARPSIMSITSTRTRDSQLSTTSSGPRDSQLSTTSSRPRDSHISMTTDAAPRY